MRSEAVVISRLIEVGHRVLLPFGTNQRYDFVIEQGRNFLTAQCKTGRLRNGAIEFRAQSVQCNTAGARVRSYIDEVDLFTVYCPDTRGVSVIPAEEVPASGMFLRLEPPRNGQRKHVRWARDYELPA